MNTDMHPPKQYCFTSELSGERLTIDVDLPGGKASLVLAVCNVVIARLAQASMHTPHSVRWQCHGCRASPYLVLRQQTQTDQHIMADGNSHGCLVCR